VSVECYIDKGFAVVVDERLRICSQKAIPTYQCAAVRTISDVFRLSMNRERGQRKGGRGQTTEVRAIPAAV
jgi:hypothetical protein